MTAVDWIFAAVCGQNAAHTWAPGGELLPCCQRCTGLYVGACFAAILHCLLKPRLTGRLLQIHGLFLLVMVPFGYHWVPQESILRTVTGLLFGAGLVTFLLVSIKPSQPGFSANRLLSEGRPPRVPDFKRVGRSGTRGARPSDKASAPGYFIGLGLAGVLTLALARSEWPAAASSLVFLAVLGVLTLWLMIGLNAAHYAAALWRFAASPAYVAGGDSNSGFERVSPAVGRDRTGPDL